MQYHYVYQITNWFNGKIYIGVHSTNILDDGYMGSGKEIKSAIKKYGKEYYTKDILQFCESRYQALNLERALVDLAFVENENTYNLQVGGSGCCILTEESRQRISEAQRKRFKANISEETRQRISEGQLRRNETPRPLEHCQNISKSKTGHITSEETKKKISEAGKGRIVSEETKKKISEGHTGRKNSEQVKTKMSESQKKRFANCPISDETRKKRSDNAKRYWEARKQQEKQ